jgi:hypothetical protein
MFTQKLLKYQNKILNIQKGASNAELLDVFNQLDKLYKSEYNLLAEITRAENDLMFARGEQRDRMRMDINRARDRAKRLAVERRGLETYIKISIETDTTLEYDKQIKKWYEEYINKNMYNSARYIVSLAEKRGLSWVSDALKEIAAKEAAGGGGGGGP